MMRVRIDKNPVNMDATALVFDLRNSTKLYRKLKKLSEREVIVEMMSGMQKEVMKYLFEKSGLKETSVAFNDTGDGYLITFLDKRHSVSCVLCACYLREFLVKHLEKFNRRLGLSKGDVMYGFGIGVHRATVRLMPMKIESDDGHVIERRVIIGNAANSAARVESATKNFIDVNLLITGYTRQEARKECPKSFKKLFNKKGPYVKELGGRFDVKDGKEDGHALYIVKENFYKKYQGISEREKSTSRKSDVQKVSKKRVRD
jgi:class 3 adenylate cyclase